MSTSSSPSNNNNNNNYDSEWEKSLESIDNFDKILIDLRKTGFTILTGLTAAGTIFQLGLNIQTGIIHATSVLVIILFWLDLYYQNVLTGVLIRAHFLELFRLKRGISYSVTSMYKKAHLHSYANYAYLGFFIAILIVGYLININIEKEMNLEHKIKYESVDKNSSSNNKLSIDISKSSNTNFEIKNNATIPEKIWEDISTIPEKIFQTELSRASLLFLIGEIASLAYLGYQSRKKRKLTDTLLQLYYYFLRIEIKSESAIDELENIIMRIMSSTIEEEIITEDEDEYEISNIVPYPRRKKLVAKLFLIPKKYNRLGGIGPERITIFWIFVSKIGILIVEPKTSKFFKIISKNKLNIRNDTIGIITDKLENYYIFEQINMGHDKIRDIATSFHFLLHN